MFTLKMNYYFSRGGFLRLLHQSGNVLLSKDVQKVQQHVEEIGQSIKSATDTLDLFDALSKNDKVLSGDLVMDSLKTLFVLQKSGNSSLQTFQITSHPQFEKLCRNLRTASRFLETNDIIQALKVLSFLGIPSNSNIMHILLNLLRQKINDISLGHIMFLEFLLKKQQPTPLVEALQIALPMLFQIQLSEQLDHENIPELVELLTYAVNNKVSDKCTMNIVSALTLHGVNLKVEEAVTIIWSLCEMSNYKASYNRLLHNCFEIVKENIMKISFEKIDNVIHKCVNKFVFNYEAFYDEDLLNAAAKYSIHNDVGFINAAYILKKFNRINFVNIALLEYVSQKLLEDPDQIIHARPLTFFNAVTAFSTANYTPNQWESIKQYLLKNPIIDSRKPELPWMKFNLELLSIGCYNKRLIEKVFNDEFLDQHLAREQNLLDYLQMLLLYHCTQTIYQQYDGKLPSKRFLDKAMELNFEKSQFPLKVGLARIFGGDEYVGTKIMTQLGQLVDHIVIFDKEQRPVAVNEQTTLSRIEEYEANDQKVVAVLACPKSHYVLNQPRLKGVFNLRVKTLLSQGLSVVAINLQQWSSLPEHERLPYLEREITFIGNT